MSTRNYGIPTVDPESTLAFVDAVNGVANATDAVLHGVAASFPTDPYELPTATTETLGGVRIGDGFKVYSDGLLTTAADKFELKPATDTKLGGVAIGNNVTATSNGVIGIGEYAFGDMEANEKTIALGGVTTPKIQDNAVTTDQVEASLLNTLRGPGALWTNAQKTSQSAKSNLWELKWDVIKISESMKIVIVTSIYMGSLSVPAYIEMPDAQGRFGSGKTVITFAALANTTSGTYTVSERTNFTLEFNFDDNRVYFREHGDDYAVYQSFSSNAFTTPGIIIT